MNETLLPLIYIFSESAVRIVGATVKFTVPSVSHYKPPAAAWAYIIKFQISLGFVNFSYMLFFICENIFCISQRIANASHLLGRKHFGAAMNISMQPR